MAHEQQEPLFYEDIYEALKAIVGYLGGAQKVGPKVWPKKSDRQAWKDLLDCLNRNNERKLDPEEIVMILRLGRDAGFHSAFHFICGEVGYHKPLPVTAREQADTLVDRMEAAVREMRALTTQAERIATSGVLKNFPAKTGTN